MRIGDRSLGAVLRFCGAVLVTSGALLLCDAGLTLAWEEPITSNLAARAQSQLDGQLGAERALAAADGRTLRSVRDPRRRARALAGRARRRARTGHAVGRIDLPTLGRSYAVAQGTDESSLQKGPGHYPGSPFPGQGGTVAIAGHRTTYLAPFRTIDRLRHGDDIVLEMPYGRFTYSVTGTRIVTPTTLSILRRVGYEQLVLTACHPRYSAARRIVVFARLRRVTPAIAAPRPVAAKAHRAQTPA